MNEHAADFGSPEELAHLLERIGLRLHAKNRIAGGESGYLWHLAQTIRSCGRLAASASEPIFLETFGDGYQTGSVPFAEQSDHFIKLVKDKQAL